MKMIKYEVQQYLSPHLSVMRWGLARKDLDYPGVAVKPTVNALY